MADNSFYPGYLPTADDVNQFSPGYYPGKPISKTPKLPNLAKPFEYDFAMFNQGINELEMELTNQGQYLPGWLKDRIVDDFKQQLKATIKPDDISVEDLDDYDSSALPGAFGISVNLNPMDWIKDPGKQASKTLSGWKNAIVNWGEIDTRVRENLWAQAVREKPEYWKIAGPENLDYSAPEAPLAEFAAQRILSRTGAKYGLVPHGGSNPLALVKEHRVKQSYKKQDGVDSFGKAIFKEDDETLDENMAQVASSVIAFERNTGFAPRRDSQFDKFNSNVLNAISTNLTDSNVQATITADPTLINSLDLFEAKRHMSTKMFAVNKAWGDKNGLKKGLSEVILEGDGSSLNFDAYTGKIDAALKDLDDKLFGHTPSLNGAGLTGTELVEFQAEVAKLKKFATPYKQHLEDLKSKALDAKAKVGHVMGGRATAGDRMAATAALRELDSAVSGGFKGKGLTGGDMIVESYQRALNRDVTNDFITGKSRFGIGRLVDKVNEKERLAGRDPIRTTRLKAYVDRITYERDADSIDSILDLLERGNFMEAIVWNRIKRTLTGLTPSMYTEHLLTKLSYFGLVIKDDETFQNHFWVKAIEKGNIGKSVGDMGSPNSLFGNRFNLKYKQDVNLGGGVKQMVSFTGPVWGGAHFKAIDTLYDIKNLVGTGDWTPKAFAYLLNNIGPDGFTDAFMTGLLAENGGRPLIFPKNMNEATFALQIIDFRQWVIKNNVHIGSNLKPGDPAYWIGFVEAVRKHKSMFNISITSRYAGLLQKLWAKLNALQNWVLRKIGKYLAPIAYVKTIVTEFISEAIIKLLDAAAGAASGGLLSVVMETLGRIIKPIIRFVVRRVVEFVDTFFRGIVTGDVFLVFKALEKSVIKMTRILMIVFGIPFFILLGISTLFMGNTLTTYSPIDASVPSANYLETYNGTDLPGALGGPGIPPPDVEPIVTGGNPVCGGNALGKCVLTYGSYGRGVGGSGHGTNAYWSGNSAGPCAYSVPYLPFPDLHWSDGTSCIGSCSPDWDTGNVCNQIYGSGNVSSGWRQVPFYGFAADYQTTCGGGYARAVVAPDIAGITEWTVIASGNANADFAGYHWVNIHGTGSEVVTIHFMHLQGLPDRDTYATGEVIQSYHGGINHTHVEVIVNDVPQIPEDVFACN